MENFARSFSVILFGGLLSACAGTIVSPSEPQIQPQPQPVAMQDYSQIPLQRFRACLAIEDLTKERLDCYDAIVPPEPKAVHAQAKVIVECRFVREEDERLKCFNSFLVARPAARPPKVATTPAPPPVTRRTPTATKQYVRRGRGGCGSRGGAGYRLPSGRCASKRR